MKYLFMAIILIACTHKKDKWLVKAQDGKVYMLVGQVVDENYTLELIDSNALKTVKP